MPSPIEWLYCDNAIRIIGTQPPQYRECGTWTVESECGFEFVESDDTGEIVKRLYCPECGGDSLWEMPRCEYVERGTQCAGHCAEGYSMCRAHLDYDEDWLADRAEGMAEDRERHPCPF